MGDTGDMGLTLLCLASTPGAPCYESFAPTVNLPRFQSSSVPLKARSKVIFDPAGM